MSKKLPIAILVVTLLAALLVVIVPFSGRLIRAAKNRVHELTSSSAATPIPSPPPQKGSWGSLISRNVPAFSSSGYTPASDANDNSYDTSWRSQGTPAWLAYNLSSVPAVQRNRVLVVWYNESTNYDHTVTNTLSYNVPEDYTINANTARSSGNPPSAGWVTLATILGNHYHSRQQLVNMDGYNWLRITVTASDGAAENYDANINMDVYNASTILKDDWIFYGDSITAGAMGHITLNGIASFAQQIGTQDPNHYPAQEAGGIGYLTSADGVSHMNTWLALFPGTYVGLSYGTNDAIDCVNPTTFYDNYVVMVQDVLRVKKVPLVPLIPWGRNANIQRCAPSLNAQIEKLYSEFPQIIHGPDLWSFFQSHQNLISADNIHPTNAGFGAYRQQWANTMLMEVYKK